MGLDGHGRKRELFTAEYTELASQARLNLDAPVEETASRIEVTENKPEEKIYQQTELRRGVFNRERRQTCETRKGIFNHGWQGMDTDGSGSFSAEYTGFRPEDLTEANEGNGGDRLFCHVPRIRRFRGDDS